MLKRLDINNIVLIDELGLEFHPGLNVMTGETGSGKSILMDALALSLGARSDVGLLRAGAASGQVISEFLGELSPVVRAILDENGIDVNDDILVLRRKVEASGVSRAWVNGVPVNIGTLRQIGDALAEIHGQFENHSLMDASTHIYALDKFGGLDAARESVGALFREWQAAESELESLKRAVAKAAEEREFLEHCASELSALNPQPGEEDELASLRARLMDAEKNASTLSDAAAALSGGGNYKSADEILFSAAHILERIKGAENPYQKQIDRLYELGSEISEIIETVRPIAADTATLESAEERLFALRAAARKHKVSVAELPGKLDEINRDLESITSGEENLKALERAAAAAQKKFDDAASALSADRKSAAKKMRDAIMAELPDLKLGQADIAMEINDASPNASGKDSAIFMIKTNPGTPAAPLHKTASGGELARLMLAMRVVLAGNEAASKIFIFDEVDTGISGATAAAVGERLAKLAAPSQAIVITHSAQVAGFGDHHYLISKSSDTHSTKTAVREIVGDERVFEVARILSSEKITTESIKNAKNLIKN
ncbi:MAG: DNA repair protein RecN [Rickettsiales bacterium]|jgi:DNA repair protein RecN (Recombination protein N)|nr:DNA repair protein RecN [Rickettsiales bacterium]